VLAVTRGAAVGCGAVAVAASIACGVATMVAVHLTTGGRGFFGVTPVLAGLAAATLGFLIVLISRQRTHEPERVV
jgi:hypothetical protein